MSNSIDVITSLDDEVHQIKNVTETLASILPADHILLVKLSDADKQALIDLFELKTNSLVQHDELNRRIDNIVVKITELSDADPAGAAEQVKLELENDIAQVLTLAQANELKIGTKADQIDLENTQIQVEQNRLSILTKADIQALALLAQLVDTKADQSYVNQQIANLVGSAPEALNTIYELAAAIQAEQSLIDSLNQSVANRVRFDIATQALTEIQKQNARTNIDAEKVGTAQQLVSQITATSIGAATAAQGAKADTALQSADVAPVALSGLFSSLDGQNKIFDVVFNTYALGTNAAITATDTLGQMLVKLQAQINNVGSGGTVSYPSFTGNANKVLAVKATEDDVEWTTALTQVYVDTQDSLLQDQINSKADAMATSQSLALKADLISGLIPASQLPSYVDDVLNFPDLVSFPSLGEDGKIYIAEDVNKTYRWGGSSYVEIGGGGVALGETSSTAYRGDRGKVAFDHSQSQGNPHNTTTSEINEGTKLFFTEPRVRQTVLTGLDTSAATPALATDQLLAAIGKLQAQINNIAPPVWVNANTLTGFSVPINVDRANSLFELAKINGMIWLRGYLSVNSNVAARSQIFLHSDQNWLLDNPSVSGNYNYDILFHKNIRAAGSHNTLFNARQAKYNSPTIGGDIFSLRVDLSNSINSFLYTYIPIEPVCLGKAKVI